MSKNAGKSEMKKANALLEDNVARLEAIGIPTIEAQKIALETPELVGLLEAEQLNNTALENVSIDPRLKQAQMSALEEISGLAQTGLGVEDKAAFNQLRREAGAAAQAEQASVLQDAAQRGTLDSGASLIAQLGAGQKQADRMSQEGDRLAAQAAQARREALSQQANMASNIRSQDYGQQTDVARARDAISQFNAQNLQNVNAQNLAARQSIANQASANKNQAEIYNKGLQQQQFQNQLSKATGTAQQTGNLAGNLQSQAGAAQQAQQALTGSLITAGTSLGSAAMKKKK